MQIVRNSVVFLFIQNKVGVDFRYETLDLVQNAKLLGMSWVDGKGIWMISSIFKSTSILRKELPETNGSIKYCQGSSRNVIDARAWKDQGIPYIDRYLNHLLPMRR